MIVSGNFHLGAKLPIDDRMLKATIAERDAIVVDELPLGMRCAVEETEKEYFWNGQEWIEDTPNKTKCMIIGGSSIIPGEYYDDAPTGKAIPFDENFPKVIFVGDGIFKCGSTEPIVLTFDVGRYKGKTAEMPIKNGTTMYIYNISALKSVEIEELPLCTGDYYSEFVGGDEYTPNPSKFYSPGMVLESPFLSIGPGQCVELMWWNGYFFFTNHSFITSFDGSRMEDYYNLARRVAELSQRLATAEGSIDNILYVEIEISTFNHNAGIKEIGSMVTDVTLTWETNKMPAAITLDGESIADVTVTEKALTGLSISNDSNHTFTLTVVDERGLTVNKTAKINFYNGVYYGKATEPEAYNSEFILGLSKNLRANKLTSFTATPGEGEYIYYCLPTRMGTCTFTVGGFTGGFTLADTISFTNASGYTEDYYIYKSDTANLGSTKVSVS